jgi:hypothetical protein
MWRMEEHTFAELGNSISHDESISYHGADDDDGA